jgi:uncharacterized protein YecE (DUF72 family)
MSIRVGTSGYSYKEWKGTFYPNDLPAARMLSYYGDRFSAVEINNTFYRLPNAATVATWATQVPDGFEFVLKATQRITHQKRLRDVAEPLEYFLQTAGELGNKLGPILFQLPPNMKADVPRLVDFLQLVPQACRAAFEFRHDSWFTDAVFDALRARGAALCIADTDELVTPFVVTADWGYLRLRRVVYDETAIAGWAERLRAQPWASAFVFFKHEDEGTGPRLAAQLMTALGPSAILAPSAASAGPLGAFRPSE